MRTQIMESETSQTPTPSVRSKFSPFISEMIRFVMIAVFIVLPIRLYIAQPFIVSGSSMDPTFANGEYLIVDEASYRFGDQNVVMSLSLNTHKTHQSFLSSASLVCQEKQYTLKVQKSEL